MKNDNYNYNDTQTLYVYTIFSLLFFAVFIEATRIAINSLQSAYKLLKATSSIQSASNRISSHPFVSLASLSEIVSLEMKSEILCAYSDSRTFA